MDEGKGARNAAADFARRFPELRRALLAWYPFPGGERALLAGANAEPMRPLLSAKYARVDEAPEAGARYDCIVWLDACEREEDLPGRLSAFHGALTDTGVLLLTWRNRFALRYLCGGVDDACRQPFGSLQPQTGAPRLRSRAEMTELLRTAGFRDVRLYYPMPDTLFTQAVYTDDHLPEGSFRDRVLGYDLYESPRIAQESDLYDDVAANGMLPFVANDYLAECRAAPCAGGGRRAVFAALSADRGGEHGFATVLYDDGTACKRPLCPAGMPALRTIYENQEAIRTRGIPTVPQRLTDGGIEMPLVTEEPALSYLQRVRGNREAVIALFDVIRADVLRASGPGTLTEEEAVSAWGAPAEALRPVVAAAYIDMIPYNAFWSEGRLRYYDQEFAVSNCPAGYVLFRALRYSWLHVPALEETVPLREMQERYGLAALWDGFAAREERFVSENRNVERYRDVWDRTGIDTAAAAGRRAALMPDRMILDGVHAVQTGLLRELDRVCAKYGLRYMAMHGTLLGAVRHGGFIPWDDDADVAMPRADYDRLLALPPEAFGAPYFLQTPESDAHCYYGGYSKLRDERTRAEEPQNRGKACRQGVWLDIFPLDRCPADPRALRRRQRRIRFLQRILFAKVYPPSAGALRDVPGTRLSLYYCLGKCLRRRWLNAAIRRLCLGRRTDGRLGILACYYGNRENRNVYDPGDCGARERMPFGELRIPVPDGWDRILSERFGADYRELPPPERRRRRKDVRFSIDMDWEETSD